MVSDLGVRQCSEHCRLGQWLVCEATQRNDGHNETTGTTKRRATTKVKKWK
jgi:hypothetical protein